MNSHNVCPREKANSNLMSDYAVMSAQEVDVSGSILISLSIHFYFFIKML